LNKLHFSVSYIIVVEYGPATNRYFVLVLNYVDIVTSLIFINQWLHVWCVQLLV